MAELKTGFCRFCGAPVLVGDFDIPFDAVEQEMLDELASERCECAAAETARKRKTQLETAADDIHRICGELCPEAEIILMEVIGPIQNGAIDSVTINTPSGIRIRMQMAKGLIRTSLEVKKVTERMA